MKIMSFNTQHCVDYIADKLDFNTIADAIKRQQRPKGLKEKRTQVQFKSPKRRQGRKGLKGNNAQADASSQTKGKKGYNALKA